MDSERWGLGPPVKMERAGKKVGGVYNRIIRKHYKHEYAILVRVTTAVPDASVLITLAKVRRVHLLKQVYGRAIIGPTVKREVIDEGKRVGAPGVQHVEQALQDGWLRTTRASKSAQKRMQRLLRTTHLHKGEIEAISIAQEHDYVLVVDDKEARHVAHAMGITYIGTAGVLLQAFREGHLTLAELEDTIEDLARVLWLSPSVIARILKMAREES